MVGECVCVCVGGGGGGLRADVRACVCVCVCQTDLSRLCLSPSVSVSLFPSLSRLSLFSPIVSARSDLFSAYGTRGRSPIQTRL